MKRFLISTAAVALMTTTGLAADLPVFEPPPEMVAPTPIVSNWSGFYIGLHGGYGWADLNDDDSDDDLFDDADLEGAVIGGQVGVNVQWNSFVLGVEGDASWSGIDNEDLFDDIDLPEEFEVGYEYLASVRGRLGLAFDRFMVYGTGGVAFTEFDGVDIVQPVVGGPVFLDDDDDDTEIGWVAGGGGEVLVTDNVSVGVEYLHYEFDDVFDDEGDASDFDSDVDVIRGRVNVKFNSFLGGLGG
jgi:outer membrane immunogenic protein